MNALLQELATQRWDDHRYYHQSRINQSLHFVSAISFIASYALLVVDPAAAALLAWGVSMTTRQAGHFFFEPRGYDTVNDVTDAYKEAVKAGFTSVTRVIALTANGADIEDILTERKRELALFEEAGIEVDTTVPEPVEPAAPAAPQMPQDDAQQDDQQSNDDEEAQPSRVVNLRAR